MPLLRATCLILLALGIAAPDAAAECAWRLKQGRAPPTGGGIVCRQGQSEFQAAMLSCERTPLHLDLEGDCGADRSACRVLFRLDREEFQFTGRNRPLREVWDGSVEIPLAGRRDFLDRLGKSAHLGVSVEGAHARVLPTRGLADTIKSLTRTCVAQTS